jgi:N-acetylneuraminic acid mutarotase
MEWTEKTALSPPRGGLAGAVLKGRLVVFGGEGNEEREDGVFPDIDAYDPTTDSWEDLPPMLVPRHGYGAATLDDRIYLMGGASRQGGGAADDCSVFYFE